MAKSQLVVAKRSAVIIMNGRRHAITRDKTILDSDDPLVVGRERLFKPVEPAKANRATTRGAARAVETATAAPAERRAARRPRKPTPKAEPEPAPAETEAETEAVEQPAADESTTE